MIADFACIYGKTVFRRHELAAGSEEVDQFGGIHILNRTGVETLVFAEMFDDRFYQFLFCCITVSLHHVKDIMSMCHIFSFFCVYCLTKKFFVRTIHEQMLCHLLT